MSQFGPKDTASVLEARYWLTPKAYAVLAQIETQQIEEPS